MSNTNKKQANDVKHRLRQQGLTLTEWGEKYGYTMRQVSDVVRGVNQANYGKGREIAEKLGLISPETENTGETA